MHAKLRQGQLLNATRNTPTRPVSTRAGEQPANRDPNEQSPVSAPPIGGGDPYRARTWRSFPLNLLLASIRHTEEVFDEDLCLREETESASILFGRLPHDASASATEIAIAYAVPKRIEADSVLPASGGMRVGKI